MTQDNFSPWDYASMIESAPRRKAYAEALKRHITPGCTVIDIGTGTGFFANLACKLGAGRVVAIEPNDVIDIAVKIAKANGYAEKIEFYHGLSTDYVADIKADVIISDLRGAIPIYKSHIPVIVDARKRLLATDGVLIPKSDTVHIALAQLNNSYNIYETYTKPNDLGLDLSAGHESLINSPIAIRSHPEHLVSEPQIFAELDYRNITSPDVMNEHVFKVSKPLVSHGFLLWFDAEIDDGLTFSNAPDMTVKQYRSQFFPFEHALELAPYHNVTIKLRAKFINGNYIWSWNTSVLRAGVEKPEVSYKQSTFLGGALRR